MRKTIPNVEKIQNKILSRYFTLLLNVLSSIIIKLNSCGEIHKEMISSCLIKLYGNIGNAHEMIFEFTVSE